MSGHKRIEEITSKFCGDWKDVVFNVNSQDSFLFVAQVAYERKLVDWAFETGQRGWFVRKRLPRNCV